MSNLISKEESLMCLTGEYLEGQEYKLDDEIHKFIKRIQNIPPVPAIPLSVIEGIKEEIENISEVETTPDGTGVWHRTGASVKNEILKLIDRHIKEYTAT